VPLAVEVTGLGKTFQSGWRGRVSHGLREVDLAVHAGATLAIVGENGAGKSTLLLVLAGLRVASSGTCTVTGTVGLVPERPPLYPRLSARQCLALYGAAHGLPPELLQSRIAHQLDRLGLAPFADAPVRTLSQGCRQRLALAQALLHAPDVLFLDEPLGGLDPESTRQIVAVLESERTRGATLVVATHRVTDLAGVCDQIARMKAGRLEVLGALDAVLASLPVQITYTLPAGVETHGLTAPRTGSTQVSVVGPEEKAALLGRVLDAGGSVVRVQPDLSRLTAQNITPTGVSA